MEMINNVDPLSADKIYEVVSRVATLWEYAMAPIVALTLAAAVVKATVDECNRPKEKPPVKPPAPMQPSETLVYGRRRNLIEAQRQWMAAESQPFEALRAQDDRKLAMEAFESWFDQFIEIQGPHVAGHVIPYDVWVLHYATYCDGHGCPKLGDQELFNALASYADANHCGVTENGELVGGQLKL
jgi:hypothetical protein